MVAGNPCRSINCLEASHCVEECLARWLTRRRNSAREESSALIGPSGGWWQVETTFNFFGE